MPNSVIDDELLCAIDLGSNSFHMAIAYAKHDELRKIASMSEKVQLGAGLDERGYLNHDAQERGLACLSRFMGRLDNVATDRLRVVATNTLRQATNSDEFITKANQILPCPIEVISGREEARLIYLGVANTNPSDELRFVIDIGGGSTELIIGQGVRSILTESAQMGAVSFTQKFFKDGMMSHEKFHHAMLFAKKEIAQHIKRYQKLGYEKVTGSSGTIKAVLGALMGLGLVSHEIITKEAVLALKEHLIEVKDVQYIELQGVKAHRKAIFPAGVAILLAVMESFNVKAMTYSDGALREGVMYDMLSRFDSNDARDGGVIKLAEKFNVDKKQAKRVAKTARLLFDVAQEVLEFNQNDHDLLRRAALLHEIGMSIGHSSYHRHSAYILEFGEIAGFSQMEQTRLAGMVRHHRRKITYEDYQALASISTDRMTKLALLLRLAVAINHTRTDFQKSDIKFTLHGPAHWVLSMEKEKLFTGLVDEIDNFLAWGVTLEVISN